MTESLRTLCAERAYRESTQHADALVIDVREPNECAQQPVPGSINLPLSQIDRLLPQQVRDQQKPLYLHCALGKRAAMAAEKAQQLGYQRVCIINATLAAILDAQGGDR